MKLASMMEGLQVFLSLEWLGLLNATENFSSAIQEMWNKGRLGPIFRFLNFESVIAEFFVVGLWQVCGI